MESPENFLPHDRTPPILVVLSGPSGVGKDAALKRMRTMDRPWHFVVTCTTRPMRPQEVDGLDYIFVDERKFQDMARAGEFLEMAQVYGFYYGVPKTQIKEALDRGLDVILKVDVQGATTIKRLIPEAVFIFLAPPSLEELDRRLQERRTEHPRYRDVRIRAALKELAKVPMFDYVVVNERDRLDEAVAKIEAIITAEKCRVVPRKVTLPDKV